MHVTWLVVKSVVRQVLIARAGVHRASRLEVVLGLPALGHPRARLHHHVARQAAHGLEGRRVEEGAVDPLLGEIFAHDLVNDREVLDCAAMRAIEHGEHETRHG